MNTVLLIVSVLYATATACAVAGVILVAVGAGYHVKRWSAERRGLQPLVAAEDATWVPTSDD